VKYVWFVTALGLLCNAIRLELADNVSIKIRVFWTMVIVAILGANIAVRMF
jgi:hypothetical protein